MAKLVREPLGEDTITTLLDLIAREASQRPNEIRTLLSAGDVGGAANVAHSLYGSAGNIGAIRLADAARAIQEAVGLDDAMLALPELEAAANTLIGALAARSDTTSAVECR